MPKVNRNPATRTEEERIHAHFQKAKKKFLAYDPALGRDRTLPELYLVFARRYHRPCREIKRIVGDLHTPEQSASAARIREWRLSCAAQGVDPWDY